MNNNERDAASFNLAKVTLADKVTQPATMIDNERTNENKIITETIQEGRCNDFDLTKISSEAYLNSVIRKYADQFHHVKRKIRKNIYSEVTKESDLIDELSFICYLVYNCLWDQLNSFIRPKLSETSYAFQNAKKISSFSKDQVGKGRDEVSRGSYCEEVQFEEYQEIGETGGGQQSFQETGEDDWNYVSRGRGRHLARDKRNQERGRREPEKGERAGERAGERRKREKKEGEGVEHEDFDEKKRNSAETKEVKDDIGKVRVGVNEDKAQILENRERRKTKKFPSKKREPSSLLDPRSVEGRNGRRSSKQSGIGLYKNGCRGMLSGEGEVTGVKMHRELGERGRQRDGGVEDKDCRDIDEAVFKIKNESSNVMKNSYKIIDHFKTPGTSKKLGNFKTFKTFKTLETSNKSKIYQKYKKIETFEKNSTNYESLDLKDIFDKIKLIENYQELLPKIPESFNFKQKSIKTPLTFETFYLKSKCDYFKTVTSIDELLMIITKNDNLCDHDKKCQIQFLSNCDVFSDSTRAKMTTPTDQQKRDFERIIEGFDAESFPTLEESLQPEPKQRKGRRSRSSNRMKKCVICPGEDVSNSFKTEAELKKHVTKEHGDVSPEKEKGKKTPKRSIEDRYPDQLNDSIIQASSSEKKRSRSRSGGRTAMASTQKHLGEELIKVDDAFGPLDDDVDDESLLLIGGWKPSQLDEFEENMEIEIDEIFSMLPDQTHGEIDLTVNDTSVRVDKVKSTKKVGFDLGNISTQLSTQLEEAQNELNESVRSNGVTVDERKEFEEVIADLQKRLTAQDRLLNDYMSKADELTVENEKVDSENKSLQYIKDILTNQIKELEKEVNSVRDMITRNPKKQTEIDSYFVKETIDSAVQHSPANENKNEEEVGWVKARFQRLSLDKKDTEAKLIVKEAENEEYKKKYLEMEELKNEAERNFKNEADKNTKLIEKMSANNDAVKNLATSNEVLVNLNKQLDSRCKTYEKKFVPCKDNSCDGTHCKFSHQTFERKKVCEFFLRDECSYGNNCKFSHDMR